MIRFAKNQAFVMGFVGAVTGFLLMQAVAWQPWAKAQPAAGDSGTKSLGGPSAGVTYGRMYDPSSVAPRLIPFQAYLTGSDGRPVADGQYTLTFTLYDEAGTELWTDTYGDDESELPVPVSKGMVNVLLGSHANKPLDGVMFNGKRYVGVRVGTGAELQPRQQIIPAIYAADTDRAKLAEESLSLVTPATFAPAAVVDASGNIGVGRPARNRSWMWPGWRGQRG